MRTSYMQYTIMVEFMEQNGDLSKPSGGPRGRHFVQMKWKELVNKLNSDGTGDPRSEEKWRKVWSDFKNNCKKKCAKINKAALGTGGGPALKLSLTDLENRVMQIIGVQAATGMVIDEAGFDLGNISVVDEVSVRATSSSQDDQTQELVPVVTNFCEEDWNTPGTSSQPTFAPSSPPDKEDKEEVPPQPEAPVDEEWRPPPQKKKKITKISDNLVQILADSDKLTREYARERDRTYEEFERERLRLRNEELRVREREMQERVRQRDTELQLQAAWMELMKEAMNAFVRYMERKS